MNETIPIDGLLRSLESFLLYYPRYDEGEAGRRLRELRSLGILAFELRGRHKVREVPVLGKGHVGVVVAARSGRELVALKIRRVDADRASLAAEAANMKVANRVSVGPRLLASSANFLVMELVEGDYLVDWVGGLMPSDWGILGRVLRGLLDKTRRLDSVGLDHGELTRAHRHVIVAKGEPRIIDFESASTARRCSNVTSIAQFLFLNRWVRGVMEWIHPMPGRQELIEALGRYKRALDDKSFRRILEVCGLAA